MVHTTTEIALHGRKESVSAWYVGVPGLLVTNARGGEGRRWAVTHALSGLVIDDTRSPDTAIAAIVGLASLADWTRTAEDLRRTPGLAAAARSVIKAVDQ